MKVNHPSKNPTSLEQLILQLQLAFELSQIQEIASVCTDILLFLAKYSFLFEAENIEIPPVTQDPARDGGNWYAYCAANPVGRWDPTGLFEVESPAQKEQNDPEKQRGYMVKPSCWNVFFTTFIRSIPNFVSPSIGCNTPSNKSRDANIPYDKGYFTFTTGNPEDPGLLDLRGDFYTITSVMVNETIRGPIADKKTFEIYTELFGGEIDEAGSLIAPTDQNYNQVRNRIGFIFGLVSYEISRPTNKKTGVRLIEGLSFSKEMQNLSKEETELIIQEINNMIEEGDLHYENLEN